MINIDEVYQTVLALADKEQRGYITPQEFNLLANQAQLEVFEQYFYDKNKINKLPANQTQYSDSEKILNEKIQIFEVGPVNVVNSIGSVFPYPPDVWRLGTVIYSPGGYPDGVVIQEVDPSELSDYNSSLLTRPNLLRPAFVRRFNEITVYPTTITGKVLITYVRIPSAVGWGYVVMEGKALYDSSTGKTTHFELHHSDQSELVYKILKLAGFTIQKEQLVAGASQLEAGQINQEKSRI
jgi:hypothetical protein